MISASSGTLSSSHASSFPRMREFMSFSSIDPRFRGGDGLFRVALGCGPGRRNYFCSFSPACSRACPASFIFSPV